MSNSEMPTDLRRRCTPSRGPAPAVLAYASADLDPWIRTFGAGILPTVAADPGRATCAPVLTHSASALRSRARGAFRSDRHTGNLRGVLHESRSGGGAPVLVAEPRSGAPGPRISRRHLESLIQ